MKEQFDSNDANLTFVWVFFSPPVWIHSPRDNKAIDVSSAIHRYVTKL